VLTQREAGGNLAEVLDNLSTVMRERFKVQREVRSKSAHGRMTAWVLSLMPVSLFFISSVASGGKTYHTMIDSPVGVGLLITGVVLQVVGALVIRKIVRIDY
jgi:tight adherence protein B